MKLEEIGSLEIVKYDFDFVKGQPKLVISMVKVLNKKGEYVKFAKLREVVPFLAKYPVKFKELSNDKVLDLQD